MCGQVAGASLSARCKAFVSRQGSGQSASCSPSANGASFAGDAGDPRSAARRIAPAGRARALLRRGRRDGSLWWLGARRCDRGRRSRAALRGLPRAGCRLRRSPRWSPGWRVDLVVVAARPLVGLRRPRRSSTSCSPLLGLWLAGRTRELALGLCGAARRRLRSGRSLGKVVPPLYDYGRPGVARLRAPVGLWNQLALLGDFALPLALWRKRRLGDAARVRLARRARADVLTRRPGHRGAS